MKIPRLAGETALAETCNPMHPVLTQEQHNCYRRFGRCMFDSSKSISTCNKNRVSKNKPGGAFSKKYT